MASEYISVQHNSKVAALQEQELQLSKIIVNCMSNPAFCLSSDAKFMYVNDATCQLVEYSADELCSMTLQDVETDFSFSSWLERWQTLRQQGKVSFQSRYRTKQGQILPLAISIHYADIINGTEVSCVFAKPLGEETSKSTVEQCAAKLVETNQHLRQEVDKLKTHEFALKTSLSLLHSTLDSTANGIVALSFAGEILSCNQKFIDMWQVPDATLLSKKCPRTQAFFENQVKDPKAFRKSIWEVPSDSKTDSYDIIELKDGRIFAQYSQPQWLNSEIIGRVWSIWDISEFKGTKEAICANLPDLSSVAQTTQTIIFVTQNERLCYVNAGMEVISGYDKAELLGNFDLRKLVKHASDRAPLSQSRDRLFQYQEIQIVIKSGEERYLACSVEEIKFANQPAQLIMAVDITQHKQAEAELKEALEQAKQLSELKERFVSMLCHQFRTPLNIVSFSADLLKRHAHQWTDEKQLPYLTHIQLAVEQISQLLDEILFFGKVEATKLKCEPKLLDLKQLCLDIVTQVQLASDSQAEIKFKFTCDRAHWQLDDNILQPVLTNLLSNALKYSPSGSPIDLEVSCENNAAIFQVKDRGIGIPACDLSKLFEPFHRGSNVNSISGTGLGLAMVKALVDIHGGHIAVSSKENAGSIFTVVLPLASDASNTSINAGSRILAVS